MAKFEIPNLANATPAFLIDESAKMSIIENYAKKMRAAYKEVLYSKLGVNPEESITPQNPTGDTFSASIGQNTTNRFDQQRFKEEHPDLFAEYLKASTITTMRFKLKEGVINPKVDELMKELFKELGLEEQEGTPQ